MKKTKPQGLKRKDRWNKYIIRLPKERTEAEEFGPGKKPVIVCPDCLAVYYKKSWHHPKKRITKPVKYVVCPACQMIKNHLFEGKVEIENLNKLQKTQKTDLINLIYNYCHRAYQLDPLDRLIELKQARNKIIVTTTENQLAQKLAKKIKDVFNKVEIETSHSAEPGDTFYIKLKFTG